MAAILSSAAIGRLPHYGFRRRNLPFTTFSLVDAFMRQVAAA
jgi:hypothetical protein